MKTLNFKLVVLFLLTFTFTGFSQKLASSQIFNYESKNPADWTIVLDAVVAAPKNHKVLLENDKVRVLEVTLAPGEIENLHHHKWPSIIYLQEADEFIDSDVDGNIILDTRKIPEPLKLPMTIWKDSQAPHSVTNLSKTQPIRLIRVEIKQ